MYLLSLRGKVFCFYFLFLFAMSGHKLTPQSFNCNKQEVLPVLIPCTTHMQNKPSTTTRNHTEKNKNKYNLIQLRFHWQLNTMCRFLIYLSFICADTRQGASRTITNKKESLSIY